MFVSCKPRVMCNDVVKEIEKFIRGGTSARAMRGGGMWRTCLGGESVYSSSEEEEEEEEED